MCQQAQPTPPSAAALAGAQTTSNVDTAKAQARLNAVNTVGPEGSVTYTPGAEVGGVPQYTQTTTLSPVQQALLDTNNATKTNLAGVAKDASGRIGGLISAPIDFSAQKDFLTGLTSGALDKTWANDEATLRSQLANKGIGEGSDAYIRAISDFRNDKSAAYNAANVNNYGTALQSQLTLRETPLNEILALAGQTGVSMPAASSPPATGVAGVDVAGLATNQYNQQVNAVNAANQNTNNTLGGLFGIGTSLLKLSDKRTKADISYTGDETNDGIPIADYRYKWEPEGTRRRGVIAQDVAERRPDAIRRIGGFMAVDALKIPEAV